MAITTVNGTSLQAAHDRAAAGDTIAVKGSGTYAGFKATKKLFWLADGGAVIEGPGRTVYLQAGAAGSVVRGFGAIRGSTGASFACVYLERAHDVVIDNNTIENGEQYGVRSYETDRLNLVNNTIRHVGAGLEVHRGGAGHTIRGNRFESIDRMISDDPANKPAVNGGDCIQLYDSSAGVLIEGNVLSGARAKVLKSGVSWTHDGSAISGYGKCGAAIIRGNTIRDAINVIEMGTDANRGGVPTDWLVEDNDIDGNPDVAPDLSRLTEGLFLRANNRLIVRKNRVRSLDSFFIRLSVGGQYAGAMGGNLVTDNDIWIKPGKSRVYGQNRAYVVDAVIVPATWGVIDGNRVHFDATVSPEVAYYGTRATRVLDTWKGWTGWGTSEAWGADVPVPPTVPTVPPVDPTVALRAEIDRLNVENDSLQVTVERLTTVNGGASADVASAQTSLLAATAALQAAQSKLGS